MEKCTQQYINMYGLKILLYILRLILMKTIKLCFFNWIFKSYVR